MANHDEGSSWMTQAQNKAFEKIFKKRSNTRFARPNETPEERRDERKLAAAAETNTSQSKQLARLLNRTLTRPECACAAAYETTLRNLGAFAFAFSSRNPADRTHTEAAISCCQSCTIRSSSFFYPWRAARVASGLRGRVRRILTNTADQHNGPLGMWLLLLLLLLQIKTDERRGKEKLFIIRRLRARCKS